MPGAIWTEITRNARDMSQVLKIPPVNSALTAVCVNLVKDFKKRGK
jgi:hypothetical protein